MITRALAEKALPLMRPEQRAEAAAILAELANEPAAQESADLRQRAAAAWERDMLPVQQAIIQALREGDFAALRGLRGLLAALLETVNRQPLLADLLDVQAGRDVLQGMQSGPAQEGTP